MSVRVDQQRSGGAADRPYADAIRNNFASLASLHPADNLKKTTSTDQLTTANTVGFPHAPGGPGGRDVRNAARNSKRSHKSAPPTTNTEAEWSNLRNVYPYLTYCYRSQRPFHDVSHYATTGRRSKDLPPILKTSKTTSNQQPSPLRVYRIFDEFGSPNAHAQVTANTATNSTYPCDPMASQNAQSYMPATHMPAGTCCGHTCVGCGAAAYAPQAGYGSGPYSPYPAAMYNGGGSLISPTPLVNPLQPYVMSHKIPSDISSESSWRSSRRKRCMIGWGLGLTALLVLALSVALFIQVRRDANRYKNKLLSTAIPKLADESLTRKHHTFYFGEDHGYGGPTVDSPLSTNRRTNPFSIK